MVTQRQSNNMNLKLHLLTDWTRDLYGSLQTYSRIRAPVLSLRLIHNESYSPRRPNRKTTASCHERQRPIVACVPINMRLRNISVATYLCFSAEVQRQKKPQSSEYRCTMSKFSTTLSFFSAAGKPYQLYKVKRWREDILKSKNIPLLMY